MKKISMVLASLVSAGVVTAADKPVLNAGYFPSAYMDSSNCDPLASPDDKGTYAGGAKLFVPRNCTNVTVANPVFVATLPTSADTRATPTLTLTDPSGNSVTMPFAEARFILPDSHKLTMAGTYQWYVTYKRLNGTFEATGTRKFYFDPDAAAGSMPTAAGLKEQILNLPHPRLFPRDGQGALLSPVALREKLETNELAKSFGPFVAKAEARVNRTDKYPDVAEPVKDPENPSYEQMKAIEQLGVAHYLNGGTKYADEARRRLVALAGWSTADDAVSSEWRDDQANRNIYYALALGLDLFDKELGENPAEKALIIKTLRTRLNSAITRMKTGMSRPGSSLASLAVEPYNSHLLTATMTTLDALMLASGAKAGGESLEAGPEGTMLTEGWDRMISSLGSWGGSEDSAFANGTYYAWMGLDLYGRSFANYMLMSGRNVTTIPAMRNFRDNFLAFTARRTDDSGLMSAFGDATENTTLFWWNGFTYYRLYALVTGDPIDAWYYAPSVRKNIAEKPLPLQAYLLRAIREPAQVAATPPELKNSFLFEDAGTVAFHTQTAAPDRSSLYFRSSRFGSYNHNHADNNAFTFVSKGRDIFISGGWYDGVNFYKGYHAVSRSTQFKNALTYCYNLTPPSSSKPELHTCQGFGQGEPAEVTSAAASLPQPPISTMAAHGKLINYSPDTSWSIVTGDATSAYSSIVKDVMTPNINSAYRTAAYNRANGIVVIYDWAESADPRYWQLNFQTLFAPAINGRYLTIQPMNKPVGNANPTPNGTPVCVRHHGNDGKFSTQPMRELIQGPDSAVPQFHTTYTLLEKSTRSTSVVVIAEDCAMINKVIAEYVGDGKWKTYIRGSAESVTFRAGVVELAP